MTATDLWQRPLSATAEGAARWRRFLDRYLNLRSGSVEALADVLEADPGLAVAHAVAAQLAVIRGVDRFDPRASLEAARAGRAGHEWERSQVGVTTVLVRHGLWAARPRILAHQAGHPDDLLGLVLANAVHTFSTEPDRLEAMYDAACRARDAVGDEPFPLGSMAMAAQDLGRLDEAADLAGRILRGDPGGVLGAHPMAHVFFESGEHTAGADWLAGWFADADDPGSMLRPHLLWHAALHHLALGDGAAALRCYQQEWSDHGVQLPDAPSLLWRCQMLGHVPPGTDPHEPSTAESLAALADGSPPTFHAAHLALALATAGDGDGLRRLASRARGSLVPGTAELVPDLATGLAAYVEGEHAAASEHLLRLEPHVTRIGGSHAQREVFEDTLIRALAHAGRLDEARDRLRARLDRRESRLDSALLAAT